MINLSDKALREETKVFERRLKFTQTPSRNNTEELNKILKHFVEDKD